MRSALLARALRGLPCSTSTTLRPDVNGHRGSLRRRRDTSFVTITPASPFHSKSRDSSDALGTPATLPEAEPVPPVKPRQRITLADIRERREKAGRLVAPTAAYSDADMFKAPVGEP